MTKQNKQLGMTEYPLAVYPERVRNILEELRLKVGARGAFERAWSNVLTRAEKEESGATVQKQGSGISQFCT